MCSYIHLLIFFYLKLLWMYNYPYVESIVIVQKILKTQTSDSYVRNILGAFLYVRLLLFVNIIIFAV